MASFQYEKKDRGVCLYNKASAPNGRIFPAASAKEMIGKDGWCESPADFGVVLAAPAVVSQAAVEAAVLEEKKLFSESVIKSAQAGEKIEFNAVFEQFTAKELKSLLVESGLSEGLDLRMGLEKNRAEFMAIIKAHNDGLGA